MKPGLRLRLDPLPQDHRSYPAGLRYTPQREISESASVHRYSKSNLIPLRHTPRRMATLDKKVRVSRLDLKRCSQEICELLRSTGKKLTYTQRSTELLVPEVAKEEEDSLSQRYSEKDHIYRHELIGTVHLGSLADRTWRRLPAPRVSTKTHLPTIMLIKPAPAPSEKGWKALSAIRHLLQLRVPLSCVPRLNLLVPREPYSAPLAFEFIMACKGGQTATVAKFLAKNRWLALEYDSVKQTGLHWAAKRAHVEIAKLLLENGAYVDSKDSVGRSPLYQACRKGNFEVVKTLLTYKANPFIKTNSGKTPQQVATNVLIQKLLGKSALVRFTQLHILLKFVPLKDRDKVWTKEGVDFFQASPDVILKSTL